MEVSSHQINEYAKRLVYARIRILVRNGFYGLLLMHMKFSLDEACETVTTDGKRIFFSPAFLDALKDSELDFVLRHEILHVALQHCFRANGKDKDVFDRACDIVVNSNILYSENGNLSAIAAHTAPDGKEGAYYTAEQVYAMLQSSSFPEKGKGKQTPAAFGFLRNSFDDHSRWGTRADSKYFSDLWQKHVIDASGDNRSKRESHPGNIAAVCRTAVETVKKAADRLADAVASFYL